MPSKFHVPAMNPSCSRAGAAVSAFGAGVVAGADADAAHAAKAPTLMETSQRSRCTIAAVYTRGVYAGSSARVRRSCRHDQLRCVLVVASCGRRARAASHSRACRHDRDRDRARRRRVHRARSADRDRRSSTPFIPLARCSQCSASTCANALPGRKSRIARGERAQTADADEVGTRAGRRARDATMRQGCTTSRPDDRSTKASPTSAWRRSSTRWRPRALGRCRGRQIIQKRWSSRSRSTSAVHATTTAEFHRASCSLWSGRRDSVCEAGLHRLGGTVDPCAVCASRSRPW